MKFTVVRHRKCFFLALSMDAMFLVGSVLLADFRSSLKKCPYYFDILGSKVIPKVLKHSSFDQSFLCDKVELGLIM